MYIQTTLVAVAAATLCAGASAGMSTTTVVDFEDGTVQGWVGPTGPGGATSVDGTAGVGGGAGLRTQFNDFGITFRNSTNPAFLDDLTQFNSVTLGVDVQANQVGSFLPVTRPWLVELRDFDAAQGGHPWASVYFVLGGISESINSDFVNYSVTIDDPNSDILPAGWGGTGAEDPNTFEPILPDGVTFADILAGYDEIVYTTLQPGFFFTGDTYDVTIDNVSITTTIPAPGTAVLLGAAGLITSRRRR